MFENFMQEFNLETVLFRLFVAFLLGGIIGIERGKKGRAAGLRTHILVSIGSAMTTLTSLYVLDILSLDTDPLRVGAQVISGIGFLGAGTILVKSRSRVTGLTTAAGLWATATIGLAIGVGFYSGAVICAVISALTLVFLNRFESVIIGNKYRVNIYMEINNINCVNNMIDVLKSCKYSAKGIEIRPARTGLQHNIGIEATITVNRKTSREESLEELKKTNGVCIVMVSE